MTCDMDAQTWQSCVTLWPRSWVTHAVTLALRVGTERVRRYGRLTRRNSALPHARRLRQAPYRLMLLMTVRGVSAREAKCVFPVRHSRRTPFSLQPYREEPDLRAGPRRRGARHARVPRVSRGLRRSKYDAWYTVGPTLVPRGFGCTLFFFPVPRRRCRKIQ